MHIGVPAETRAHETRVAATPETVRKYVSQGHRVAIQSGAGTGASFPDDAFTAAGAEIVIDLHDTDYGSRDYSAKDPEGYLWDFGTYDPAAPPPM